jgi:hypothetical protein
MNRHPVKRDARFMSGYILFILLAALPLSSYGVPIHAVPGEDIPLRGRAPGLDVVYLFLTGPNLPTGGISLASGTPVATGVPASFTRVEVNTDGAWAYTWRAGSMGRILDQGTYVIYAVNEPLASPDLDDAVYTTQAVILGAPVGTVIISPPETTESLPPGTMQGGPLVTGMQPPAAPTMPAPSLPPASTGRLASLTLLPLGAVALAVLGLRHGW